jgi:hypothetical protein
MVEKEADIYATIVANKSKYMSTYANKEGKINQSSQPIPF